MDNAKSTLHTYSSQNDPIHQNNDLKFLHARAIQPVLEELISYSENCKDRLRVTVMCAHNYLSGGTIFGNILARLSNTPNEPELLTGNDIPVSQTITISSQEELEYQEPRSSKKHPSTESVISIPVSSVPRNEPHRGTGFRAEYYINSQNKNEHPTTTTTSIKAEATPKPTTSRVRDQTDAKPSKRRIKNSDKYVSVGIQADVISPKIVPNEFPTSVDSQTSRDEVQHQPTSWSSTSANIGNGINLVTQTEQPSTTTSCNSNLRTSNHVELDKCTERTNVS